MYTIFFLDSGLNSSSCRAIASTVLKWVWICLAISSQTNHRTTLGFFTDSFDSVLNRARALGQLLIRYDQWVMYFSAILHSFFSTLPITLAACEMQIISITQGCRSFTVVSAAPLVRHPSQIAKSTLPISIPCSISILPCRHLLRINNDFAR